MREVTTDLPHGYRLFEDGDLYLYREGELYEVFEYTVYDFPLVMEIRLFAYRDAYEQLVEVVG